VERSRTVYGNSNALCQLITILPDERRDSPKVVDLQVVVGNTFGGLGIHNFEINVVLFGYCSNCYGACVALQEIQLSTGVIEDMTISSHRRYTAFRKPCRPLL